MNTPATLAGAGDDWYQRYANEGARGASMRSRRVRRQFSSETCGSHELAKQIVAPRHRTSVKASMRRTAGATGGVVSTQKYGSYRPLEEDIADPADGDDRHGAESCRAVQTAQQA